ncbi:MAG: hypothetical protein AAF368_13545 [Planctomycetota bacterium]
MQHPGRFQTLLCCLLGAAFFAGLSGTSQARRVPTPIYDLFGASELVVIGSISKVGVETFRLDVEEVLRGSASSKSLTFNARS